MIRLVLLGILLGCLMPLGALAGVHGDDPYRCPTCAVLVASVPCPGPSYAVVGGHVCAP